MINNLLTSFNIMLLGLLMTREIIAFPILIYSLFVKKGGTYPQAKKVAKITTFLQGIAIPLIWLQWPIAIYSSVITAITGIFAGRLYWVDNLNLNKNN